MAIRRIVAGDTRRTITVEVTLGEFEESLGLKMRGRFTRDDLAYIYEAISNLGYDVTVPEAMEICSGLHKRDSAVDVAMDRGWETEDETLNPADLEAEAMDWLADRDLTVVSLPDGTIAVEG